MIPTHTSTGFANLPILYGVDLLLYCEGGGANEGESPSYDEDFWARQFEAVSPQTKVRIEARGSKSSLQQIASALTAAEPSGVAVAWDRDFGPPYDPSRPQILCTYGTTLESDVYALGDLEAVLLSLVPGNMAKKTVGEVRTHTERFIRKARWLSVCSLWFVENGVSAYGKAGGRYISEGSPPTFRIDQFKVVFSANRNRLLVRQQVDLSSNWPRRNVHGKMLWTYVYRAAKHFIFRLKPSVQVSPDALLGLCLSQPKQPPHDEYGVVVEAHYRAMIENAVRMVVPKSS